MNKYFRNLSKIEFVLTYACTGRCKHCSEGDHAPCGESINPEAAADAVRRVASDYDIRTVMVFGGEPLLVPDAVYSVMRAARDMGVPHRQLITNGYFTRSEDKMREVAMELRACGVNDLLLSADAFHQESIPLEAVRSFAVEVLRHEIPVRFSPAWLVSRTDGNPYNLRTREILESLGNLGIREGEGNVVFPEGNALRYLSDYFRDAKPENPYTEDPCNIKCLSFEPNGDVLGGNVYKNDIMEIIDSYVPGTSF